MSDFASRLVARTRGVAPLLQPLRLPRFASGPDERGAGFVEAPAVAPPAAPRPTAIAMGEGARQRELPPVTRHEDAEPVVEAPAERARSTAREAGAPEDMRALVSPGARDPAPDPARRESPRAQERATEAPEAASSRRAFQPEAGNDGAPPMIAPLAPRSAPPTRDEAPPPSRTPEPPLEPIASRPSPVRLEPAAVETSGRRAEPPREAAVRQASPPAAAPSVRQDAPEPPVVIEIGAIEFRSSAPTPAAAQPSAPAARRGASLSLGAYLDRRGAGR